VLQGLKPLVPEPERCNKQSAVKKVISVVF
jgi:hypothetical protein